MGVESLLRARLPGPQEELKSASSEGTQPRFSPLGTCQRRRQCCSSTTGWCTTSGGASGVRKRRTERFQGHVALLGQGGSKRGEGGGSGGRGGRRVGGDRKKKNVNKKKLNR